MSGTRPRATCGTGASGAPGPHGDLMPHRARGQGLLGSEARTGACRSEDERGCRDGVRGTEALARRTACETASAVSPRKRSTAELPRAVLNGLERLPSWKPPQAPARRPSDTSGMAGAGRRFRRDASANRRNRGAKPVALALAQRRGRDCLERLYRAEATEGLCTESRNETTDRDLEETERRIDSCNFTQAASIRRRAPKDARDSVS